ncbi:PepSY domain-containing protein [Streptomyces sp. A012304]|uniref:PepSY domain-containing protein n=1 Tax=Streptomyces sp. A012304 TaxID=375446 RepID=UPI002231C006|nr:PepSY domain-containing protein [Streptomyces sp. A012304]GKQ39904.1 hypothetical protein ALMP_64310 [Streptomyces sp. A012304]
MKRKLAIAAVAASVVIGAGAAVAFADDDARGGSPEARPAAAAAGTGGEARSGQPTAAEVIAAALKHTPGTAVAADRDDDGARAWQVDIVKADGTEYTVDVSATTGEALGAHRDADDADDADDTNEADDDNGTDADGRADLAALKGTSVDAREAALAAAAKGTVTDVDLDDDARATAWSVETAKGGEWKVDARTGKVTQDHDD